MRERIALTLVALGLVAGAAGCKKPYDQAALLQGINQSFAGRHECVWTEPTKLPAQADPSKDEKTRDYEALTDAGLLIRTEEEKKKVLVGSKQVNNYDLSDKGHNAWTPDPSRPGYGNFCFGHKNATAIVDATPNDRSNPTQYAVHYQYETLGIPGWAQTPASMRAFPKIAADTSIQTAAATLVKGEGGAWTVAAPAAP